MGEIKSVKVDNWGVFFLQKLQNFFNKTDYCDLTLQFRDNSQLKVHRLVLSACTDYFNVLEQTCEMVDDALLMPDELQADVVVPIVNFMYTGTLEFELKMYGKLLRTAKEMNMTVLLKLLEAHRRTMEGVNRSQKPPSPKPLRRRIPPTTGATSTQQPQLVQQQRRILATSNAPQQGTRVVQTKTIATNAPQQQIQFRQQIGSTSLLRTSASGASPVKAQHSTAIYNRQQIKQEAEDYDNTTPTKQQQPTSPFEQLRKGYNNNKRPATTIFVSPPAKKPNIEDVKEFAEQQRMRKQIAAEYGEDPEYEGMLDDDIHNDDDDDETTMATSSSTTAVQATTSSSSVVATSSNRVVQHGTTTITFKHDQNDKPPTIVVKDSSNSNINHTKIITEVLRQYPHLVKNNKNIKLKIMPNVGGQTQKIVVKREQTENISLDATGSQQQQQVTITKSPSSSQTLLKPAAPQPQQRKQPLTAKLTTPKVVTSTAPAVAAGSCTAASTSTTQKRRIDSKTMHALIALGAENTTGPWLCLRCGVNGRPISIPSYRGFRRHLINTHKETIDPTLCEHCGWRSNTNRDLHFHIQVEHKVKTTLYTFPECLMCAEMFLDTNALNQHMVDSHADENKQQCIYCNKIFAKELQLYNHMKTYHKKQALADGIIDYSDEEFAGSQDEAEVEAKKDTKVKILSDISLTNASSLLKLEPSSEAAALSTVASGIATSIGVSSADEEFMHTSGSETASVEPKFVNADGNEMLLTDEQRKEIMSQLNQEHEGGGGVVMLLNEPTTFTPVPAAEGSSDAGVTIDGEGETKGIPTEEKEGDEEGDDQLEHDVDQTTGETSATEEEFEDSQIYNELTTQEGESKKNARATLEESKESIDNLEWAENLISAHELADEVAVSHKTPSEATIAPTHETHVDKVKKEDDISKKLKELTGDWSDDENDDNDLDEGAIGASNPAIATLTTTEGAKVIDEKLEDTKVEENQHKSQIEESEQKEEKLVKPTENIKEAKDDEDDIEVAMRSLHKEEVYKDKVEVEDDVLESTKLDESSVALEQDEMPECKDKCQQYPNEKNEQKNENKADTSEIEGVEKELTDEEEEKHGAASLEGDTSKSLIDDELISEEIVPVEPQEFDKTKNVESKNVEAESKIAIAKVVEAKTCTAVELMETDDKVSDLGEDVCTTISAVDAIEKEDEKDEPASVSNTTITTETVEKSAPIGTTVAVTSESKADDSEPTGAKSETTNTKSDDQVKSLISEWADADDEDDIDPANAEEEEL